MWVVADYLATALFSLKPAWATSSGGKTLLVPTPFAIKMALVDVVCRTEGVGSAEANWEWLRDLTIALRPAREVVVNNTFTKILKPRRSEARQGSAHAGPYYKTIGYREYAHLDGTLGIALGVDREEDAARVCDWLIGVNYLGKRGGFVQIAAPPRQTDTLPEMFVVVLREPPERIPNPSLMQQLDECGPALTFEQVNVYTSARIRPGKDRLTCLVGLPYRVVASSRGYTQYELVTNRAGR
ncbi:MAG TPA: hypothetical protein VMY80_12975 [Anaerolineae bacterium]|nr:hypothetical protein [Anaerolineae bacterium]